MPLFLQRWFIALCNRLNYRSGSAYAEGLLKDGWTPGELRRLPALAPTLMPNGAYADGFFDMLTKRERT